MAGAFEETECWGGKRGGESVISAAVIAQIPFGFDHRQLQRIGAGVAADTQKAPKTQNRRGNAMPRLSKDEKRQGREFLEAAERLDLDFIKAALARSPGLGRFHDPDRYRETALMIVASQGSVEGVRALLPHSDAKAETAAGVTALMFAASMGSVDCVLALLPLSNPKAQVPNGCTALMEAALVGRLDCVCALLPVSDANAKTRDGTNALILALRSGATDCAWKLAPKTDLRAARNDERTALMWAARLGDAALLKALLPLSDAKAEDVYGSTALDWAADAQTVDCVEMLLSACGGGSHRNKHGKSPFEKAWGSTAKKGEEEMWKILDLLAEGAPAKAVEKAFAEGGPEKMPRWAAKVEAEAIAQALAAENEGGARKRAKPSKSTRL